MAVLRWLAATAVLAGTILAIDRVSVKPCRCDIEKQRLQKVLLRVYDIPTTTQVVLTARTAIASLQLCIGTSPTDVDMYMTLAAFQRVTGHNETAILTYRKALEYDRRPELFLNVGLLELELNRPTAAMEPLIQACLFNINFINEIPESVRADVLGAVKTRQARGIAQARRTR